jgi:hypothetical protein
MIYPAEEFTTMGLETANKIVVFISHRFIRMQKCNGTYKDFISIAPGDIMILQIRNKSSP